MTDQPTHHLAVIGNPIAHSRSPEIHGHFAAQCGLTLDYQRLLAPADDFAATAERFLDQGGLGFNVTVPFKSAAAQWVDRLDSGAAASGAVNTVLIRPDDAGEQQRWGYNTDGIGLIADLQRNLGIPLAGQRVLLLGAGGAAAGVIQPLLAADVAQITVANRTAANARRLAERFAEITISTFAELAEPYDLVINSTSIGLSGDEKASTGQGFSDQIPDIVVRGARCYDMLYGPAASFSEFAQGAGAHSSADGLGMLVEQAAAAFTLWFGFQPDTAPVIQAMRAEQ
ncbi:MAG: shikimate dehydrogenase [Pseudomonadales bacterium]